MIEITREVAAKVLAVVDAGLVSGMGVAEPGKMCVEAAVCYALGLPHGDNPKCCVSQALRAFKMRLNEANWSSEKARASGLRRLALLQLGSAGHLDEEEFVRRIVELVVRKAVPSALRNAASIHRDPRHQVALMAAADMCEKEGTKDAALEAKRAAGAATTASSTYATTAAAAVASHAFAASYAAAAAAAAYAADADAYAAELRDKALASYAEDVVQIPH